MMLKGYGKRTGDFGATGWAASDGTSSAVREPESALGGPGSGAGAGSGGIASACTLATAPVPEGSSFAGRVN
jgi:hypothetical protein